MRAKSKKVHQAEKAKLRAERAVATKHAKKQEQAQLQAAGGGKQVLERVRADLGPGGHQVAGPDAGEEFGLDGSDSGSSNSEDSYEEEFLQYDLLTEREILEHVNTTDTTARPR